MANPAAAGFLTAYPSGADRPSTSNLNFAAGQTVANLLIAQVQNSDSGAAPENFYVSSTTDLVVDVSGYFTGTYIAA